MKIYFVRHGESVANILQVFSNRGWKHGLTQEGEHQAALLAEKMRELSTQLLYTSPLLRAFQTANILSSSLGIPLRVRNALPEFDCGILEGKSDLESWKLYDRLGKDWMVRKKWDAHINQGESFLDVKNRFIPFIEHITKKHSDSNVILVGHGGTYRVMFPLILANIDFNFTLNNHIGNTGIVTVELQHTELICTSWGKLIL